MRGRMMRGVIALGMASTLGGWGCAAPTKRAEAPIQFRQWKAPTGPLSAKAKAKYAGESEFPVTEPSVVATNPRFSIWNYRPGSLLFRRKPASTPPAMPMGDSPGSLSHYFPGLSGKSQGESLKVAQTSRPENPLPGSPTPGRRSILPSSNRLTLADDASISVLPVGLRVENSPKPPTPSLPEAVALAKHTDEPKDAPGAVPVDEPAKSATSNEQLTSHEQPVASKPSAAPDLIDGLSLDLQIEPSSVSKPEPAPRDLASQPASKVVEVPAVKAPQPETPPALAPTPTEPPAPEVPATQPPAPEAPATQPAAPEVPATQPPAPEAPAAQPAAPEAPPVQAPTAEAPAARTPVVETPPVEAPAAVAPDLEIKPLLPPVSPIEPVRATSGMASPPTTPSTETAAVPKTKRRFSRVEPMELPLAEFPSTYHAQSISRVLKEDAPADSETLQVAISAKESRRTYFPRLTRLLSPKAEVDRAVKPASNSVIKPKAVKPLALSEPGQVPEWWQGR